MQQALRGVGPSPVPHIQHPPPNSTTLQQPQPRGYPDTSPAHIYDQQQRMIQQQQQNQVQAHREHQMAVHRSLGIQQQMAHPSLPTPPRQIPMVVSGPGNTRQVRPMPTGGGWVAHPTIPGARVTEGQMQQYQMQQQMAMQQAAAGYAPMPPQAQQQRAMEQQYQQNQLMQQHQAMSIQAGYRMVAAPTAPQLVQQGMVQPQHLLRQQSVTSTPTRPPLAHALTYLETNTNPLVVNAVAGPSSAGPTLQHVRAPSRASGRHGSPMPPPSVPAATPSMQASASASAIPNSATLQPAILPPRSNTLPLPAPRLPIGVAHTVAGPSSAPSHTPHPSPPSLPILPEEKEEPVPPRRIALRETMTQRLKQHLGRTERQLEVAVKVERTLKRRKLGGRSSKEMSRDEKWRGRFDDLVLEYLERGGYQSAVEGFKADRKKPEPMAVEMEKNPTNETTLSGDAVSGDSTMVEEVAKDDDAADEETEEKDGTAEGMEVDGTEAEDAQAAPVVVKMEQEGVVKKEAEKERDLGRLFSWYTVQRFSSQITTTLQSAAVREFRSAVDLVEAQHPDNEDNSRSERTALDPPSLSAPSAPNTALIPSSATATQIIISAPHAALRAASVVQDAQADSSAPLDRASSAPGLQVQASPNDLEGLTATFQKADNMRAAQEAQIREQQAAKARAEAEAHAEAQARAQAVGSSEPDEQRIEVQMGDQIVTMAQSDYNRLYAAEQERQAQHQHQARMGMVQQHPGQHVMVQQQHPLHAHQQHQQQHQQMYQHPYMQQQMMMPQPQHGVAGMEGYMGGGGPGPGTMKRGLDEGSSEGSKRIKIVRKPPTPEEHQRQAIEMANKARSLAYMVPPGAPQSVQAAGQRPGLQRHPSESDLQFAQRHSEWMRQFSAGPSPQNPYQQQVQAQAQYASGMTPIPGGYEDHATPQTADILSARTGVGAGAGAGLVPSPTASRASHKKRPAVIGVSGAAGEGEMVTPTSGKKRGGKKGGKASAKGKKGKQGTPGSADGPVTPFTIPETPAANIAHTPSHPPGEFRPPSDAGGSSQEQELDEPTHHVDQQSQQHQQLQVQLLHHRQHGPGQLQHQQQQHNPYQQQSHPSHFQNQQQAQAGQQPHPHQMQSHHAPGQAVNQFLVNGNDGAQVFDGMGLDDDLMKALGGYPGDPTATPHQPSQQQQQQPPSSAAPTTGAPQSAAGFDTMGFDLDPNGGLNFDWDNVDFGSGDAWGDVLRTGDQTS